VTGVLHIAVVMKPLDGNFAQNALKHGVAGLNIDGCRVRYQNDADRLWKHPTGKIATGGFNPEYVGSDDKGKDTPSEMNNSGRWPANVILGENADKEMDKQNGVLKSGDVKPHHMRNNTTQPSRGGYRGNFGDSPLMGYGDSGGASRFFFQVKEFKE
jgi:hypothetical protein